MYKLTKQLIFLSIAVLVFGIGIYTVIAVNNRGAAPVAWWKFDEGYGSTAYDAAGANDGTIYNAAWRNEPDCKSGKCLYFDGSGDYVNGGSDSSLDNPGYLTMTAWVKVSSFGANDRIISKPYQNGSWTPPYSQYEILIQNDGDVQVNLNVGGTVYIMRSEGVVRISLGKWHYLVFTWDGTTPKLYIDGILKISSFESGSPTGTIQNYDTNLWIGWRTGATAGTDDWDGLIDDIRIYNYARTAAQIKADYMGGASRGSAAVQSSKFKVQSQSEGLLGHWKMDETSWTNDCSTATVIDSSGSGKSGKSCPATTGPTGGASGKYGNAGSLDGSDDYLEIPDIDF